MSSKPTSAISCWRPSWCSARRTSTVSRFWLVNSAVGASGPAQQLDRRRRTRPPASIRMTRRAPRRCPAPVQRGAVAGEALDGGVDDRRVADEGDPRGGRGRSGASIAALGAAAVVAEHAVGVDRSAAGGRRRRAPSPSATSRSRWVWSVAVGTTIRPSTRRASTASISSRSRSRVLVGAAGEGTTEPRRGRPPRRRGGWRRRTGWRRPRRSGRSRPTGRSRGAACRRCGCAGSRAARPRAATLTASSGATGGLPLTTRETVLRLTPATAATSFIVGRRPFGRRGHRRDRTRTRASVRTDASNDAGISPEPRAISRVGTTTSAVRRLEPGQPREQQLAGLAAERVRVLGDDGDARVDEVAEHDVVEAGQRDLALQAERAQRADRADRDQVLAGEERRRRARRRAAARASPASAGSLSTSSVRSSAGSSARCRPRRAPAW